MFSRDPMNLTNKHSRKYEGFTNSKVRRGSSESLSPCPTILMSMVPPREPG